MTYFRVHFSSARRSVNFLSVASQHLKVLRRSSRADGQRYREVQLKVRLG